MPLEENAKVVLNQAQGNTDNYHDEFEYSSSEDENLSTPVEPLETPNEDGGSEAMDELQDVSEFASEIAEEDHRIEELVAKINDCTVAQKDLEAKVIQTLKENVNFQIQVRQNMQKELEDAKKKLSGDIFVPLLKEIAELYVEWSDVINELEGIPKKKVIGIFDILQELLEENGCVFATSEIGSKRKTKYSKLKNKVLTSDKSKHETIAKSYNPWIVKEPFVLYPEYVDVYVFDPDYVDNLQEDIIDKEIQFEESENNEPTKEEK